jgi:hypothetical protein
MASTVSVQTDSGVITGIEITDGGSWTNTSVDFEYETELRGPPTLTPSFARYISGAVRTAASDYYGHGNDLNVINFTDTRVYFNVPTTYPVTVLINGAYYVDSRQPDGVYDMSLALLQNFLGSSNSVTVGLIWWPMGGRTSYAPYPFTADFRIDFRHKVSDITIVDGGYGHAVDDTISIVPSGGGTAGGSLRVSSVNKSAVYNSNPSGYVITLTAGYTPNPPTISGDRLEQYIDEQGFVPNTTLKSYYGDDKFAISTRFEISDPQGYTNPEIVDATMTAVKAFNGASGAELIGRGTFVSQIGEGELQSTPPVCISVIDESSPAASTIRADWLAFRDDNPNVPFYLLQPEGYGASALRVPTEFVNDPIAFGPIGVNRPGSNRSLAAQYDWFTIAHCDELPSGTKVYLSIDNSGSMTISQVQAARNILYEKCQAAGLTLVEFSMGSQERWSQNFLFTLAQARLVESDITQRFTPFNETWDIVFETPEDQERSIPIYQVDSIDTSNSEYDVINLSTGLLTEAEEGSIISFGAYDDTVSAPQQQLPNAAQEAYDAQLYWYNEYQKYLQSQQPGYTGPAVEEVAPVEEPIPPTDTDPIFGAVPVDITLQLPAAEGDTSIIVNKLNPLFVEEHNKILEEYSKWQAYVALKDAYDKSLLPDYIGDKIEKPLFVPEPYKKSVFLIKRRVTREVVDQNKWKDLVSYNKPTESVIEANYVFNVSFKTSSSSAIYARQIDVEHWLYWNWRRTLDNGGPFDQVIQRTEETGYE